MKDIISHLSTNFNEGLTKPPLKLGPLVYMDVTIYPCANPGEGLFNLC